MVGFAKGVPSNASLKKGFPKRGTPTFAALSSEGFMDGMAGICCFSQASRTIFHGRLGVVKARVPGQWFPLKLELCARHLKSLLGLAFG